MVQVIRFTTAQFDVSAERPNPINPIPGESLLLWLKTRTAPTLEVSEPDAEDWGWYAYVAWEGRQYMLGSSAMEEEQDAGAREWVLLIEKQRSLTEKLLGREKMAQDDACAAYFLGVLEQEPAFKGVSVDPEVAAVKP